MRPDALTEMQQRGLAVATTRRASTASALRPAGAPGPPSTGLAPRTSRACWAGRRVREAQRRARLAEHVEWMASSAGLTARESTFTRGQVIEALAAGHPKACAPSNLEAMADRFLQTRAVTIAPARIEPGRGRVPARLTQTELAQILDISQKRVSEIERGEVDRTKVDTLRRYAAALGGTLRVEVKIGHDS